MGFFHKGGTLAVHTQIGESAVIDGSITSNDNIKIDGRINGSVSTRGDVLVTETGFVAGGLYGCNLYIEGEVDGGAIARENLVLSRSANITGKVEAAQIEAEEGARFETAQSAAKEDKSAQPIKPVIQEVAEEAPASKPKKPVFEKPEKPEFIAKPQPLEMENVSVQTIQESKQTQQDVESSKPLSEEEEKEAFLKTFFFHSDSDH